MRIALLYPKNPFASWYTLGGYVNSLRRLGHDVVDIPFPGNEVRDVPQIQAILPKEETLADCDAILSTFHEYVEPWIMAVYGPEAWARIMAKVPVVARFDESMDRSDLRLNTRRVEDLKRTAHAWSFPAAQDAAKFGGRWHPFGADIEMFKPPADPVAYRDYRIGFIGSLYTMRLKYLEGLAPYLPNDYTFHAGQCFVQHLDGVDPVRSTTLLSENYARLKLFFCLPPMSRLVVAKVFEVLSTGTFLMYPKLPGDSAENLKLFEDGVHLAYYDPGSFRKNATQVLDWITRDEDREKVAAAGRAKIEEKYTLDHLMRSLVGMAAEVAYDQAARPVEASVAQDHGLQLSPPVGVPA